MIAPMPHNEEQQNNGSADTTSLYAWLSRDGDGIEGIITVPSRAGLLPLVMADADRARAMKPAAIYAARKRNHRARLVRFSRAEVIEEIGHRQ